MTAKEFFYKVKDMREAQRLYFRTRQKEHLEKSKYIESKIDKEIARAERTEKERTEPKLF